MDRLCALWRPEKKNDRLLLFVDKNRQCFDFYFRFIVAKTCVWRSEHLNDPKKLAPFEKRRFELKIFLASHFFKEVFKEKGSISNSFYFLFQYKSLNDSPLSQLGFERALFSVNKSKPDFKFSELRLTYQKLLFALMQSKKLPIQKYLLFLERYI